MSSVSSLLRVAVLSLALLVAVPGAMPQAPAAGSSDVQHVIVTPESLHWTAFAAGIETAVVSGDPSSTGPYVLRIKTAAGTRIPAHWHPNAENVTVLSGDFSVGMGDKFTEAGLTPMPVGAFARIPDHMHHFAFSRSESIVQVNGMGPFVINFVDPADDPRLQKK